MFHDSSTSASKAFAPALVAGFLMLITFAPGVFAQSGCQSALNGTTGFTTLDNGDSTSVTYSVVEWDGEVIKLYTNIPGVVSISASGSRSHGSLFTAGSSSTHPLVDRATVGTSQRQLKAVVGAGYHCVQLTPGAGASGNIQVTAAFTDVCHLGTPDDHGDSFLCATPVTVGGTSPSGEITSTSADDSDMFVFTLTSSATVTIASTGGEQAGGSLFDADGELIASDNTGWSASNFSITQSLAAGTYYIQVTGPDTSAYGLSVTSAP
ncbi:MAG: pre-peptidase C-terminal domain-containing protein [Thermoanaerobaculia bacterium]